MLFARLSPSLTQRHSTAISLAAYGMKVRGWSDCSVVYHPEHPPVSSWLPFVVIPGWSEGPGPESRSADPALDPDAGVPGFRVRGQSPRPGMTAAFYVNSILSDHLEM
jgi:hypothetical protein